LKGESHMDKERRKQLKNQAKEQMAEQMTNTEKQRLAEVERSNKHFTIVASFVSVLFLGGLLALGIFGSTLWRIVSGALAIIIFVTVFWFMRSMRSTKRRLDEIERAGGNEAWHKEMKEKIARGEERTRKSEEQGRISRELMSITETLKIQINRNVYTEQELPEIDKLLNDTSEMANRDTELTMQLVKLTDQSTKLINQNRNTDEIDKQIETLDARSDSSFARIVANLEELKRWVELGQQR